MAKKYQGGGQIFDPGSGQGQNIQRERINFSVSPIQAPLDNSSILRGIQLQDSRAARRQQQENFLYAESEKLRKERNNLLGAGAIGGGKSSADLGGTLGLDITLPEQERVYNNILARQQAMQDKIDRLPVNAKPDQIRRIMDEYRMELAKDTDYKKHVITNKRYDALRDAAIKAESKGKSVDNEAIAILEGKRLRGEFISPEDLHLSNYIYDQGDADEFINEQLTNVLNSEEEVVISTLDNINDLEDKHPGITDLTDDQAAQYLRNKEIDPFGQQGQLILTQKIQAERGLEEARNLLLPAVRGNNNAMRSLRNGLLQRNENGEISDEAVGNYLTALLKAKAAKNPRRVTSIDGQGDINDLRRAQVNDQATSAQSTQDFNESTALQRQKTRDSSTLQEQKTEDAIKVKSIKGKKGDDGIGLNEQAEDGAFKVRLDTSDLVDSIRTDINRRSTNGSDNIVESFLLGEESIDIDLSSEDTFIVARPNGEDIFGESSILVTSDQLSEILKWDRLREGVVSFDKKDKAKVTNTSSDNRTPSTGGIQGFFTEGFLQQDGQ